MGVLGLTPFLQKTCPEVIKTLPDRLNSLRGKTVAIDGTLITMRLHFAPMPHRYRHVLGWHRIISELNSCDIRAICVFDGKERNKAKARENERRKEVRKVDTARAAIEDDRLRRLKKIQRILPEYRKLKSAEREQVTEELKSLRATSSTYSIPTVLEGISPRGPRFSKRPVSVLEDVSVQHISDSEILTERLGQPVWKSVASFAAEDREGERQVRIEGQEQRSQQREPQCQREQGKQQAQLERHVQETQREQRKQRERQEQQERQTEREQEAHEVQREQQAQEAQREVQVQEALREEQVLPERQVQDVQREEQEHQGQRDQAKREKREKKVQQVQQEQQEHPAQLDASVEQPAESEAQEDMLAADLQALRISEGEGEPSDLEPVGAITTSPEGIRESLASLYQGYQLSTSEVISLPAPSGPSASAAPDREDDEGEAETEARAALAMSKSQLQMTLDEGKFWDWVIRFSATTAPPLEEEVNADTMIGTLAEKSVLVSESYTRRTKPPTTETYDQCKEILRAMGVPCVDIQGPYEAEAVAASMVAHGQADYVASEDTDVLVYEVPLLRNIASKDVPLMLLEGLQVRDALQLSDEQYVDFAILLGTDFSQRIKNVGPARALRFIRKYGTIEKMLTEETKYPPKESVKAYLRQVEVARLVYTTFPPCPDPRLLEQKADLEKVREIFERCDPQWTHSDHGDYHDALTGNYFSDNPSAF
ncbi:PIN domain-like protein [Coniophora puteana RWD-64-598 SS2]|uniref:PIN domain-like protein n=1 Tax=Coniophora puteana (strain RWD-64-598) TaxID=741705 RepID=A0A5M3MHX2_CONPW|nr:PIN domain-like protein [Coniophora puteana RWD-64-598 SS2]EIW78384.1 PIN domain-like protein [Coniophora puteana RWD-64-598 SS2]